MIISKHFHLLFDEIFNVLISISLADLRFGQFEGARNGIRRIWLSPAVNAAKDILFFLVLSLFLALQAHPKTDHQEEKVHGHKSARSVKGIARNYRVFRSTVVQ